MTRTRLFLRFVLLLPLLSALAPAEKTASIARLALEHDRLTAGDLARVSPAWQGVKPTKVLSYAPLPGIERRVTRAQLLAWAKRQGLDLEPQTLPDVVIVSRRMRELTEAEAQQLLAAAVSDRYRLDPDQVQVELHDFEPPLVPAGKLSFHAGGPFNRFDEENSVPLRWRDGSGRSSTVWLRATISIAGSYAVARDFLESGAPLRSEDFTFQVGPLPGDPGKYLLTPRQVKGMSLKRSLKSGEALSRSMLVKSRTVRRGDLVELRLQSRSIVLRAPGRAEQSGSLGDTIACRNIESGQRVEAVIVDPKHVEVEWIP